MKAWMFAGGGLFLSMVATTMWMSGDVERMRNEQLAKRQAECAQQQAAAASAAATSGQPGAQLDQFGNPVAPQAIAAPVDEHCADIGGGGAAAAPGTAAATEQIDPITGQPVPADAASAGFTDPNAFPDAAGAPVPDGGFSDPSAVAPAAVDPALATGDHAAAPIP